VEFGLLGPLEVRNGDGRTVPLGGPKQRTVLAHLLLRAGQFVPAERLIDELWGEEPPVAARNVIQAYVSHLRKALGPERLEGRSGGYVFHVEQSEIDVFRFEGLVRDARKMAATDPVAAVELYGDALALWRAPPLDDLADQPSLRVAITRLQEQRLAATEERLAAELGLGRHAELVPELETLTAQYPLRERLWSHLITALYRSARQGDALAALRRVRGILVEQLGIDPSPELQKLEEQILTQDPVLGILGQPLRGYRLFEQIGAGSFGVVYRASQPHVGREVAVKLVHPHLANDAAFIRRFEAEAQFVARLEHPHVVPLYDFWREPDGAYLVMRYFRGGSLRDTLARGPLGTVPATRVVEQIGTALAAAHHQGIVHRDVKPANILFDDEGNAYLSDFGIARDVTPPQPGPEQTPGALAHYLSPEEVRGEPSTPRTDIYSLGFVLYEMLAGQHPYAGSPPLIISEKHLREAVPSLRSAVADIPAAVDDVIARATAKEPEERYQDAASLVSALRVALAPGSAPVVVPAAPARNPYKGLRPFLEADAPDFFGREELIARLTRRLAEGHDGARFLAVVGPSGSGKSSLVRAGLVPALRSGAVPGSEAWFVAEMVPGEQPFAELETALLHVAPTRPPEGFADDIERDDRGLIRAAEGVLPDDGSELLLVVDQTEELFTLVDDENRRARFLASLVTAATDPASRVRVVLTLRADFYDRPLLYPALAELLRARTEVVVPLTAEELEQAATGPAGTVGVELDPGLVARLVADVADQPGGLPLLQYALTELFDQRQGSTLTTAAYRDIGGIAGALARRAEGIFDSLSDRARDVARHLFLRLVTFGEGAEDTRRRVLLAELVSLRAEGMSFTEMNAVIDRFGAARLLSFDRDPATRNPTVEVAHEALLREWDRLRGWIDEMRGDLRTEHQLARAARDWLDAGRDTSFLVAGPRLEQFEALRGHAGLALAAEERDFVDASLTERERRQVEEEAQRARERTLEHRSLRRLRVLVGVLTLAALIAGGLTVLANSQRGRAQRQEQIAQARELAAAAVANLGEDPERSVILALEAVERARPISGSVLVTAEEALHEAVAASRIVLRVPDLGGGLDWSPDGRVFVTEGPEETGVVDIRDATTGESLLSFDGHDIDVNLVAFSADGSMLATTGDDGAARVWDPATGEQLWGFRLGGEVWGPSFSPDGSLLAAASSGQSAVRIWDLATGEVVREVDSVPVNFVTTFSPDGQQLAIATDEGGLVIDVASGEEVFALQGQDGVRDVDWSPDGRWIATASFDSTVRIWEADTGKDRFTLFGHTAQVVAADWSPDSSRLVTGSEDGTAKVWEITEAGPRELLTLPAQERGGGLWVAFAPGGNQVMTGDQEITAVKIWDVSPTGGAEWAVFPTAHDEFGGVAFSPDGRLVLAGNDEGSVTAWQPQAGNARLTFGRGSASADSPSEVPAIDVSRDGRLVAAAGPVARVWDARTGEETFAVGLGEGVADVAWSPDGSLLAAAGHEGRVKIVDRSGRDAAVLDEDPGFHLTAVRFSPDGRHVATARLPERPDPTTAQVTIWDWERNEVVTTITGFAEGLAFDPTGRRIAIAPLFGPTGVWEVDSGRKVATLAGHTGTTFAVAFAPDGATIATASADATVRLWDAESSEQRLALRAHTGPVWDLAFSPNASKLASASLDGTVRVWALDLDDLIEIAEGKLTRGLTDGECRQYLHVEPCPAS
jgi:WD40 repeat protein/DNA-binding SARP family transcriptional activator